MKAQEIRRTFLEFFRDREHEMVPSSPVVPVGDNTLLFTNAGMNQFKDIFTGRVRPEFPRATTVQKCIRAGGKHNDLDNVGYTTRHLTFFEMLGNFSFGDYFKERAIRLAWELVVGVFGLPVERLVATVYNEDDEARKIWREVSGLPEERIVGLGKKDNYWSMGDVGPCGPCSEILFDRGDAFGEDDIDNGERFFEIWNLVFMQFDQKPGGDKVPLPSPSIDTGMGLERMAMVLQDVPSVFEIDVFARLVQRVEELTGTSYDSGAAGVPHRVIADHIRTLVFAFADGAQPSNEGRGYVLRRILRRAARYARKIHSGEPVLHHLVADVVDEMGDAYPEIRAQSEFVTRVIHSEEERFGETLDTGIELFDATVERVRAAGGTTIPGGDVFRLYDTFGFPADLVERMAAEIGLEVDMEGFEERMAAQKERSRGASQFAVAGGEGELDVSALPETKFVGYETTHADGEIQAAVERAGVWRVVLSDTPFYGEAGGQVGDTGSLQAGDFRLAVDDTQRQEGRFVHLCRLVDGDPARVASGAVVTAAIDEARRASIQRNHSATHLVHAALRAVAGEHVRQKGSLVSPERLRFDVTHYGAFEPEEMARAEALVREWILEDHPVDVFETSYDEAVAQGAMALFGEKYGDRVRVVRMGEHSTELCGGTHVGRTGEIGPFVLLGEGSVSSGVRRLEALTAFETEAYHRQHQDTLAHIAGLLRVAPDAVVGKVERLLEETRELRERLKRAAASGGGGDLRRERVGEVLFIGGVFPDVAGKGLREVYDGLKTESPKLVAVLIGTKGGKLGILVAVSRELVAAGVDARELFPAAGEILGAQGGGRAEMVQAGGSLREDRLQPAIEAVLERVRATCKSP